MEIVVYGIGQTVWFVCGSALAIGNGPAAVDVNTCRYASQEVMNLVNILSISQGFTVLRMMIPSWLAWGGGIGSILAFLRFK